MLQWVNKNKTVPWKLCCFWVNLVCIKEIIRAINRWIINVSLIDFNYTVVQSLVVCSSHRMLSPYVSIVWLHFNILLKRHDDDRVDYLLAERYLPRALYDNYMISGDIPTNLYYKTHLCRQQNCWSLRCIWSSITCRRCSNNIFIPDLTHGLHGFGLRQLQDETRKIKVLGFGVAYIRNLTVGKIWSMSPDPKHII